MTHTKRDLIKFINQLEKFDSLRMSLAEEIQQTYIFESENEKIKQKYSMALFARIEGKSKLLHRHSSFLVGSALYHANYMPNEEINLEEALSNLQTFFDNTEILPSTNQTDANNTSSTNVLFIPDHFWHALQPIKQLTKKLYTEYQDIKNIDPESAQMADMLGQLTKEIYNKWINHILWEHKIRIEDVLTIINNELITPLQFFSPTMQNICPIERILYLQQKLKDAWEPFFEPSCGNETEQDREPRYLRKFASAILQHENRDMLIELLITAQEAHFDDHLSVAAQLSLTLTNNGFHTCHSFFKHEEKFASSLEAIKQLTKSEETFENTAAKSR